MNTGDKIVCIRDSFPDFVKRFYTALPVKGRTYVVRDVRIGIGFTGEGAISLLLCGLENPKAKSRLKLELGFCSTRFVPLEEARKMGALKQSKPNHIIDEMTYGYVLDDYEKN